jgi:hypothetical protein
LLVRTTADILRAFSEGHIGWRDACRRLDLEKFDQLEELMIKHNLGFYQPEKTQSQDKIDAVDNWLYGNKES